MLIRILHEHNPDLNAARWSIRRSQASERVAIGGIFPQQQDAVASARRFAVSGQTFASPGAAHFSNWQLGALAAWELDCWGRFRYAIDAAGSDVEVAIATHDDLLVLLQAQVARSYVRLRVAEAQLNVIERLLVEQERVADEMQDRERDGVATRLDVLQVESVVAVTQEQLPGIRAQIETEKTLLCQLTGVVPGRLDDLLGIVPAGTIPEPPAVLRVGLPADLLVRRPDVRRAYHSALAQSHRLGVSYTDFYPRVSISGDFGWSAEQFADVWRGDAFEGSIGPAIRWPVLNYGRIWWSKEAQNAVLERSISEYRAVVLAAYAETDVAIAVYDQFLQELEAAERSTGIASEAADVGTQLFTEGNNIANRLFQLQQTELTQTTNFIAVQGTVAQAAIAIYASLGGGWRVGRSSGQ